MHYLEMNNVSRTVIRLLIYFIETNRNLDARR